MSIEIKNMAPFELNDLAMANRLLASIAAISKVISAPKYKFQAKIDQVLAVILDYLQVEHGSIMLLEKKKWLVVKAASRKDLLGIKQSLDENSVAAWVARHAQPLFVPDITEDKRFARRGNGTYKKTALLSAPIISNEKVVGVINVTDKTGTADLLKDDTTYLLEFTSLLLWLIFQEDLNSKLKKKKNTLDKRNKELKRQENLRADLTRSMVHDLKGPLSEVVANLDIMSYSLTDENKEFLESAQLGCDRAVRMVSNLVSVDKIEDGNIQLLCEKIAPDKLLAESISGVTGLAKIKNVDLVLEIAPDLPQVSMDRILVLRVLQNLLTNALEYAPQDSKITSGCALLANDTRFMRFFVQDEGEGIAEQQQKVIFEKYARVGAEQEHAMGTGLGLFFCKLAVEEHRGRIGVESSSTGSCFYFTLPV